jgi:DNA-binding SARP family transcriptional activator
MVLIESTQSIEQKERMVPEAAGSLRVRVLGRVQAWRSGVELDLGSAYRRSVFTVLALRAGEFVSRDEMIDAVWGEDMPASASGSVYTYVSGLRSVLEPRRDRSSSAQLLTSSRSGYCLHVPPDDVDALKFEALRERMRHERASGDARAELAAADAALQLWAGDAFAGIPGPFAEAHRLRLAELRIATIERRAALLVETGSARESLDELRDLAQAHPLRESFHGLLMTALHRVGRKAEALEAYWRAHRVFVDRSGTEPSAVLRELYDEIATATEVVHPPKPVRARPVRSHAPFVGRAAEVAVLREAVSAVATGRGGSIWIEGEPGIGKSALLVAGLQEADAHGCRVGWGVGDEYAQRLPLSVLLESLDGAGGLREPTPGLAEQLRAAAGGSGHSEVPPGVQEQIQSAVHRLCAAGPLVLVVDNVQWADDASLLAWHLLQPLTGSVPLLLIAAGRPAPGRRQIDLLRSALTQAGCQRLLLPALSSADAVRLAHLLYRDRRGRQTADAIADLSGGNPLYLTGLVDAGAPDGDSTPIPSALTTTVNSHLTAAVGEDTRDLLRAAALLGDTCSAVEIAAVTGRPAHVLLTAVEEALAAGVLIEAGEDQLTFRHPLVRRVLYDGTPTTVRRMLHRDFAEKLAARFGAVERVAWQLLAGAVAMDEWSCRWLADHLDALVSRDPDTATALLGHARTQPNVDATLRETWTATLARLLLWRGEDGAAEAEWVAVNTSDAELAAEMRWIVAMVHHRRGDADIALATLSAAIANDTTPTTWHQRLSSMLTRISSGMTGSRPAAARRAAALVSPRWRRNTSAGVVGEPAAVRQLRSPDPVPEQKATPVA